MIYFGLILVLIASIADGLVEGFDFDNRKNFEVKYDVDENGFWGSLSSKKLYDSPSLWSKHFGTFDFYHVSDDIRKYGYISGAGLIGSNYSIEYFYIYVTVFLLLASLAKRLSLSWIRE